MPTRIPRTPTTRQHRDTSGRPVQPQVRPPHEVDWYRRIVETPSAGVLGPYIDSFIRHFRLEHDSLSSAYYYRRELNLLANYFPRLTPTDYTRAHLLDYTSTVGVGLSPRSRKRIISIIRVFFRWLEEMEIISKNPAVVLRAPKIPKPQPRFLEPEQVNNLLNHMDGDLLMQVYAALGCYAGLRRGNIHTLEWEDVDFDQDLLTIRHAKGDKSNHIPIARELKRLLIVWKTRCRESDCPLVIAHLYNGKWRPYSWSQAYRMLKKYMIEAGLPEEASAHDLRRTFATTLHRKGVSTTVISRLLGHSDISTTHWHYTFTSDEQKEAAIASLSY
ncbi:MAG: tyrosine-type recombinase/integrase [Actinobacteria bacterium]|nr:tyrosine-type recombinase/integrase [Actinomycetota bacterium]